MNENMDIPNNSEHQFSEVNPMADNRNAGGDSVPPSVTSVTPSTVTLTTDEARRLAASLVLETAEGMTDGVHALYRTLSAREAIRVGLWAIQLAAMMLRDSADERDDSPAERAVALFMASENLEPIPERRPAPRPQPKAPAAPPVAPIQSAKAAPAMADTVLVTVVCPFCDWTEDHIVPDDGGLNHRESHCHAGPYIIAGSTVAEEAK